MRRAVLTIAAALFAAAPAVAQAQSAEATVDRAVTAYERVKTLRATFRQELTNPLLGRTMNAQGEMLQRMPGQLAIRFTDPAGDRIVADGRHVWVYLPSTNPGQAIKMSAARNAAGVHDVTAMFLEQPRERYAMRDGGTATVEGRATRAVHLTPRDRSLPFTRATVWIDNEDAMIRQFEVTETNGLVRKVTITSLTINPSIPASAFTFTPPEGVRVHDQTGMAGR